MRSTSSGTRTTRGTRGEAIRRRAISAQPSPRKGLAFRDADEDGRGSLSDPIKPMTAIHGKIRPEPAREPPPPPPKVKAPPRSSAAKGLAHRAVRPKLSPRRAGCRRLDWRWFKPRRTQNLGGWLAACGSAATRGSGRFWPPGAAQREARWRHGKVEAGHGVGSRNA